MLEMAGLLLRGQTLEVCSVKKKFRSSLCKMRLFLGMCFGHGAMRRQDEISTLLRLSVTV